MAVKIGTDPNVPVGRESQVTSVPITTFLVKANNLSDVPDAATARANLGISALGDMVAANNLSDVVSVASARSNLQLNSYYAQLANNLSDLANRATALSNLSTAQILTDNNDVELRHTDRRRVLTHEQGTYFSRDIIKPFPTFEEVKKLITNFKGHQTLAMNMQTMGAQAWYHEGTRRRVYFTFMGRLNWNAPIEYLTNYVSYYDLDSRDFAEPVDLGTDYATLVDVHLMAFPVVDSNGYIHIYHETGKTGIAWDSNSQHNTNIIHKVSDAPEDIETFSRVGAVTNADESYPKYWKLTNGNYYGIYRNNSQESVCIHYSDNEMSTWKNMAGTANQTTEVCRLTPSTAFAYSMHVPGKRSDGINIVVMDYDLGAGHSIDNLYFLHSDDGITWENVNSWKNHGSGEFSKNIVSTGYITHAELDANFKIPATTAMPLKWNMRCGAISPNGMPIIQYVEDNTTTNRIDNAYIAYWIAGSWTHVQIREHIWSGEILNRSEGSIGKGHVLIPYSDTNWDLIVAFVPDGRGLPINDDSCMNYGNMTGDIEPTQGDVFVAQRYMVVATNGIGGIPAAYNVGDTFNCLDNGALDANNVVKPIRMAFKVMRTSDAGVTWHQVREFRSNSPFGMTRSGSVEANFMDTGKLFFFMGDSVSSDRIYPDASDVFMVYDNLYPLM
jgi:hypothetical protein